MSDITSSHEKVEVFPGFDGLRLFAALAVVFSHSFFIAEGTEAGEPFNHIVGLFSPGKNIIGLFGVFVFFIISGFLLLHSLVLNPNAFQFALNRLLRILPGFTLCAIIVAFVIVPFASPLNFASYLQQPQPYAYVMKSIICMCDAGEIKFVPEFSDIKNGSLWSLSAEVASYLLLLLTWMVLRLPYLVAAVFSLFMMLVFFLPGTGYSWFPTFGYTLPYFASGVLVYAIYAKFGTNSRIAILAALMIILSVPTGFLHMAFAPLGAYVVVHLGGRSNVGSRFTAKFGDLSYGIYLYGWPVTTLMHYETNIGSGYLMFGAVLPVVMVLAAVSWWGIEKSALKLKPMISAFSNLIVTKTE